MTILIFISITIVLIIRKYNTIDFKDRIFNLEQKLFNEIKAKEAILSFNKVNMLYTINCYDKSKETLSTFMKSAEEDLRKISGMDMLVSSNATEALGVLKPLTQLEGPYGFIVVDNVFKLLFLLYKIHSYIISA